MNTVSKVVLLCTVVFQSGCVVIPWVKVIPLVDVVPQEVVVQNQKEEAVDFIWKDTTNTYAMVATVPPESTVKFDILKREPGNMDRPINWYGFSVSARGVDSGVMIPGEVDEPLTVRSVSRHRTMNPNSGAFYFVVTEEGVIRLWYPGKTIKVKSELRMVNSPDSEGF